MRVLLIEDDRLLGEGIRTAIERLGWTVDWVQDGVAGLAALRDHRFDAVVLDLGLPRQDGLSVLREYRRAGGATPVLILTARDAVPDRIGALDAGADDYLGKPFDVGELAARLRALQRRASGRSTNRIVHGAVTLDPTAFVATHEGRLVDLPRREFALMQLLLENVGRIVTREAAIERLYGWDREVESNAVEVHVHHLRRKFYPELIRTVRGVGYLVEAAPP